MGKISGKVQAELRSLPLMLGKALGGIAAVVGFGMAVFGATRSANLTAGVSPLASFVVGTLGILIFVICGRLLARRVLPAAELETTAERRRTNVLAWGLLLFFVLLCLGALLLLGS